MLKVLCAQAWLPVTHYGKLSYGMRQGYLSNGRHSRSALPGWESIDLKKLKETYVVDLQGHWSGVGWIL